MTMTLHKTGTERITTLRRVGATVVTVEKAISITYSECVSGALHVQYAIQMRHITVNCVLSVSAVF
jgi:hypothetical protein